MSTVAALFSSQAEASEAIGALAGTKFEDVETTVYEGDVADDVGEVRPAGLLAGAGANLGGASPQAILDKVLTGLDDEELSSYFVEEVETGQAVLVVAEVDDEDAVELAAFFQKLGGRTSLDD
ncbi:MAG: hypothetical protein RRC07_14400 [Anaerolineae bacterium]|nr:hypothetical protein [Anaerolineae bacterium]